MENELMIRYKKFRNHPIWTLETIGFHICKKRNPTHPKWYLHSQLNMFLTKHKHGYEVHR